MFRFSTILASLGAGLLTSAALAAAYTDTFESGLNPSGWTFGFGNTLPTTGGNPGGYLRTDDLDTFAPQPRPTAPNNPFIGDYRARGVTCIGVDLITYHVDFSAGGRPLTLMLIHDNNTPGDPSDDTAAYYMHPQNVPLEGQNWISYLFDVPSASTTLPAGWTLLNLGDSGAPANHTWNQVIQHVSKMQFFYGNPEFFFIFQQWSLGMDNARICTTPPCPADVAPSGNPDHVVNIDDLLFIINHWGNTGTPGSVPGDVTNNGVVNIDDLLAVINAWGNCPS
jgi:hypothetical protein